MQYLINDIEKGNEDVKSYYRHSSKDALKLAKILKKKNPTHTIITYIVYRTWSKTMISRR